MHIEVNQTLLFIGDSITDCGRDRPVGRGAGLGSGYVDIANGLLNSVYPELSTCVLNTGIGGNRVTDMSDRWQSDVLELKPDWLSILIGINDVWRQFDSEGGPQVDIGQFELVYRNLLDKTRPTLEGLILMSPFFLEPNKDDPMRRQMDAYGHIVQALATDYNAVFVDVQAAFDRYLALRPSQSLCGDRVHPNTTGHTIIATSFLDAIGFDWGQIHQ